MMKITNSIPKLRLSRRHIQLAKVLNNRNGCTIPLSVEVAPVFQIHGSSTLSVNRYCTIHAENMLGIAKEKRKNLGGQSPLEVLKLEEKDIPFFDFGTVTSSRTPNARLAPPEDYETILFLNKKEHQFFERLLNSKNRRDGVISNCLKRVFESVSPTDDIERKVHLVNALEAILEKERALASDESSYVDKILLRRKKQIAQELGDTVRDMLGWNHITVTAESGTYLNAHLSILTEAKIGVGGCLNFSTNETGRNAPRAAALNQLHFGSDQAGRNVDHSKETSIFKDERSPGLVYVAALRNEKAEQKWGEDKEYKTFGEWIVSELVYAIAKNREKNSGKSFSIAINIPDRSKTSTSITIEDLRIISEFALALNDNPAIDDVYFIIDGCQSRGESIKGIHHKKGPIIYYEEQGVHVDGVSWTTSKGPGGSPFAAGLTLRHKAYTALRKAIEKADEGIDPEDGFIAKYIKQGDFPESKDGLESIIEKRAIPDFSHHLRLLGDIPRLWRWAEVYTKQEYNIAVTKDMLAKELTRNDKYFHVLKEASDPSVLNMCFNPKYSEKYDLSLVAKLLRLGFDLDKLEQSKIKEYTLSEKAAALLATPTGQTVVENAFSEEYGVLSLSDVGENITHKPIIRFAINLELAETAAYNPKKRNEVIPKIGNVINTRIALILQNYEELTSYLSDIDTGREIAEDTFYQAPPELRYYNEEQESYAVK